jgi:hypothetical protein
MVTNLIHPAVPDKRALTFRKLDLVIMPLLSVFTLALIFLAVTLAGRRFVGRQGSVASCMDTREDGNGWRGIPNKACVFKGVEAQFVRYQFNSCGDYTDLACDRKSPGAYRIVLVGSSYGFGWGVPKDQSFATLLPKQLSRRTGRKIELYNQSMVAASTHATVARLADTLAAKPDLILWVITPQDLVYDSPGNKRINGEVNGGRFIDGHLPLMEQIKEAVTANSPLQEVRSRLAKSAFSTTLKHYLYQSQTLYVRLYLMSGDQVGFLQSQFSSEWKVRLQIFDNDVAIAAEASKKAGVPLVVSLVPDRILSTVLSMSNEPAGIDAYKLDHELRNIVLRHGGEFLDLLPAFRSVPNPQQYYMPVDDHPYARGHQIISDMLANGLAAAVPTLANGNRGSIRKQTGE